MAEKKTPPNDSVSRIQNELLEVRQIGDLADPLRDVGMMITWLRIMIENALKGSIYRDTFVQTPPAKLPLPYASDMLAADSRHFSGFDEKPIVAKGISQEQLRALLAAIRSMEGTAWAVEAVSELLRPAD